MDFALQEQRNAECSHAKRKAAEYHGVTALVSKGTAKMKLAKLAFS